MRAASFVNLIARDLKGEHHLIPFKRPGRRIDRAAIVLWIVLGAIALAVISSPSVVRTQEGRVLLTARQMAGSGFHGRLVPRLNGFLRLQKPPIAYWLADLSYHAFGRDTAGVGRVPFAFCAWLTAGLNLWVGTRLFGRLAGTFAMAGLMGCLIVARYGLLAETDVLTMLGVSVAVVANWRGAEAAIASRERLRSADTPGLLRPARRSSSVCFHIGAIATGLTIMSKGPQGVFPFLFLIGLACLRRSREPLVAWLKSGAPLTVIVIALPWFAYLYVTGNLAIVEHEVSVASFGGAHQGTFLMYLAYIPADALPWTGFLVAALFFASRRARRDPKIAAVLMWIAVILVPLCLAGQKQRHYLLPLMPPLMLLGGWCVDRASRAASESPYGKTLRAVTFWTSLASLCAGVAVPIVTWREDLTTLAANVVAAAALVGGGLGAIIVMRKAGVAWAITLLCSTVPAAVLVLQNVSMPLAQPVTPRTIAANLAADFPGRPVRMMGIERLPLMFETRALPGALLSTEEIVAVALADPQTLFLERLVKDEPSNAPPFLAKRRTFVDDGVFISVLEVARPSVDARVAP